jgi:hypothetical protein
MTNETLDNNLEERSKEDLIAEVKRLRAGIRRHRDSSGHDLCWHHPQLWNLLPEKVAPELAVPEWPQFLRGCLRYRESLDRQLLNVPRVTHEFEFPVRPDDSQVAGSSRSLSEKSARLMEQIKRNRAIMLYAQGLPTLPARSRPAVAAEPA